MRVADFNNSTIKVNKMKTQEEIVADLLSMPVGG